jgi:ABC-type Fe3+-hydroxamate transport system substrate-binding protein
VAEPGGSGGAGGTSLSFENDIYPIIEVSCATASCHGNPAHASKLYMPDVETAYRNLVEADATYPCTFTNAAGQKVTIAKRVVPGNPEASALRQRVRPGPPAECPKGTWSRMPKGSFPSDGHTAAVLQWIAGGARP